MGELKERELFDFRVLSRGKFGVRSKTPNLYIRHDSDSCVWGYVNLLSLLQGKLRDVPFTGHGCLYEASHNRRFTAIPFDSTMNK
jgi:hypothetical protein